MKLLSRFNSSTLLLSVTFLLTALALLPHVPLSCNSAHAASGASPGDYCYQTEVEVTYVGVGTLTDFPVRVEIPGSTMVNSGQLDPRAWDIYSAQGSFSNSQHLLVQEVSDAASATWIIVPEISAAGGAETFDWYTGQNVRRRDQSIYFTGVENATTPDHADFDITDNLDIYVTLTNHDDTPRTEFLFDRRTGVTGFRVAFTPGAPYAIYINIETGDCSLPWDSAWNSTRQDFHFQYISDAGNDTFIYRNGVLVKSCDLDLGAISVNNEVPTLGSTIAGTQNITGMELHSFRISDTGVDVAHWDFDADHMEETVETNPFQGTVDDLSGNSHTLTYTFTRPQTDITTVVSETQITNLGGFGTISQPVVDLLGGALPEDALGIQSEQTGSIFHNLFLDPIGDTGFSRQVSLTLALTALGMLIAIGVWLKTDKKFMPVAVMLGGFPIWLGAFNGWVPWWYAGTWAMIVLFTWFTFKRSEEVG